MTVPIRSAFSHLTVRIAVNGITSGCAGRRVEVLRLAPVVYFLLLAGALAENCRQHQGSGREP